MLRRMMMACVVLSMGLAHTAAQVRPEWPEAGREAKAGCRWWWLGSAVDEANLKWQMEQLAAAGVGTLEITPIYGVKGNESKNIQFLSGTWLGMLDYTQQLGDQLGIDIDMTTGTGWPFGGPMVKTTESASKLVTETQTVTGDGTTELTITLATTGATLQRVMAFPQAGNDGPVTNLTSLVNGKTLKWKAPAGGWNLIAAYNQYGIMQVKRPAPGSSGLVLDYFDSTAVANYLQYFDARFEAAGARWPHSFFNDSYEINQADWTPKMFEQFERRRGYRLDENLDKLLNRDKQVYADYRQTLSDMLYENFTLQWTRWANSHGATARNQAHGSPGNLIDLYAAADVPETENFYMNSFGIKGLRNDKGFYNQALSTRATLKYASSAAHITGKRLTSSESMTWLTEHFRTSLSQVKPELDLLFTSGVNHVLFHGTAYSPKDAAWPGWKFYAAVDMSPTNSIWHDAPSMMQYIERVQSFLQMGQPDNDVLVYAPFANAMHKNTGSFQDRMLLFDINTLSQKMTELEQAVNALEQLGLDCDYTSERYLMHTTFADGMLQAEGGARYRALVIPTTDNMPDSVRAHVEELRQQGAQVVEGRTAEALSALTVPAEELRSRLGLSVIRRQNTTGHHYFVANLTANDVQDYVPLAVPFQSVAVFDPLTGRISQADTADGRLWLSLKSGQSVILQTYDQTLQADSVAAPVHELAGIDVEGSWTLTLDGTGHYQFERPQTWETLDQNTASWMGQGTYETTFHLSAAQLQTATAGFRLDLGDVRESARVWLNGQYLGCAWSVPFVLDCQGLVREGSNTLRIEVTNLPANRISDMDRQGVEWRIFEDINMSNISTPSYAAWELVPSGLNSAVRLIPLTTRQTALDATLVQLVQQADGYHYPQYRLTLPGQAVAASVTMTDDGGGAFTGFTTETGVDGSLLLTVTGHTTGMPIVQVTDQTGTLHYAYVTASGAYSQVHAVDFTSADALADGLWDKMGVDNNIIGFSDSGKQSWYRSKRSAREHDGLFDGLLFQSESANYYMCFPGYGLNAMYNFQTTVRQAAAGDLCQVSYVQGDGTTAYEAADSVSLFVTCDQADGGLVIPMQSRSSYVIYRSLQLYRPLNGMTAVRSVVTDGVRQDGGDVYTLQGLRVRQPRRGIYVRNGRKFVVK